MIDKLSDFVAELKIWREQDRILPVWWRDDDATAPSPALDRLLGLSARFGAPLHLAVIPEPATEALATSLHDTVNVFVLPHGWQHRNNAPSDQKKAEFGAHRPLPDMLDEIAAGWRRTRDMFGLKALPVFTPPWNRIDPQIVARLPECGIHAVSTFGPRKVSFDDGVFQVNTHVDPIAWHGGGGLVDPKQLDLQLARDLRDRRTGQADNSEPYGLLTHHLVQDEATWAFTALVLEMLAQSGASMWTSPLPESST